MPTGAQALLQTLLDSGVDTCFTNPGTSEMHFVAALDDAPEMRAVLTLFEGVATGAADGYGRMADAPAATLLHLGPGLGNGLANLHNARRARTPVVNIVGDHATHHAQYDAPLQSDIAAAARNVSPGWVRTPTTAAELPGAAAAAIAAAMGPPGQVATLIVPADASWQQGASPAPPLTPRPAPTADDDVLAAAARRLRGRGRTALLLGGRALQEPELLAAQRIAEATGATVLGEVFPTRIARGAGRPTVQRIPYLPEFAMTLLGRFDSLLLVDTERPASFFAYPDAPSDLVASGTSVDVLVGHDQSVLRSLGALADRVGAPDAPTQLQPPERPALPTGTLTAEKVCQAVGALLPEDAIISDEAQTSGVTLPQHTAGAPPHDVLTLTGGSIGQGLPVAVGAAIACPDRPVLSLQADGSAMYTLQSLWTMAREELDVTVVICNNASYAILNVELQRVGVRDTGDRARQQLDLSTPTLDFTELARGMGVPGVRVETAEDLARELRRAFAEPGPHLIDAIVPSDFTGLRLKALPYALKAVRRAPQPIAEAITKRLV